jgi:hypothetical protein
LISNVSLDEFLFIMRFVVVETVLIMDSAAVLMRPTNILGYMTSEDSEEVSETFQVVLRVQKEVFHEVTGRKAYEIDV